MKYIKGFDKDLKCRGMQYEVGKEFKVRGKLKLCSNGIHFCDRWMDVIEHYNNADSRYCEVVPIGEVIKGDDKYCAHGVKILRELTAKEIVDEFIPDIEAKDNDGRSPLYLACCNDNNKLADLLRQHGAKE